ncbi:unnamed protein product [Calypogeia fissa]
MHTEFPLKTRPGYYEATGTSLPWYAWNLVHPPSRRLGIWDPTSLNPIIGRPPPLVAYPPRHSMQTRGAYNGFDYDSLGREIGAVGRGAGRSVRASEERRGIAGGTGGQVRWGVWDLSFGRGPRK